MGDLDADGRMDIFVTAIYSDRPHDQLTGFGTHGNYLYRNNGGRSFSERAGLLGLRDAGWGWGCAMLDYDNDGDKDLLAINGYVMPESTFDDEWNLTPSRLWRNPGAAAAAGPWPDIADELGLADTANGRGLLLVDYDLDGDLDVFQANYAGPPRLFRNDGPSGAAWLRVVALEAAGGRESLGAKVKSTGLTQNSQVDPAV